MESVSNKISIEDTLEFRRLEEELARIKSLHNATLEATADGILVVDTEGHVVSYNKMFLRLWLIPEDVAERRNDDELLSFVNDQLAEPEEFMETVHWLYSNPQKSSHDLIKFKDGRIFERLSHPQKIGAEIIGRVWSFRDVTERENEAKKKAMLIEKVESINKELEDFAYVVSHDLKAPLRGIKTLANWIANDYRDKLDNDGREQINLLTKRVDRMHNLIDEILQYSRIGRIREEKVAVNTTELVLEIIDALAAPEHISISIESDLPTIEFEPTRLTQVFQNLLSNAIKYCDKPMGQININCYDEGDFWKFSISDNGMGIEEKYFGKIFKIFQTLSTQDDFESTGVGLSLVKKIIQLYDGKIWIESTLGQGSTFYFSLPKNNRKDVVNEDNQSDTTN